MSLDYHHPPLSLQEHKIQYISLVLEYIVRENEKSLSDNEVKTPISPNRTWSIVIDTIKNETYMQYLQQVLMLKTHAR